MTDYLKKILDDLPESQQDNAEVKQEGAQAFHTIVEKLLVLCKRARTDILTGVDFFTMRVREPEKTTTRNYRGYLNISTVRGILYLPWNTTAPER